MASSTATTLPWKYDVFISFREEDTGKNFTSHLFAALHKKGVTTFQEDGHDLQSGKPISQKVVKAIRESRISIIVFSRNFASSRSCLDELVEIFECTKVKGQVVLPVFYSVDPADVRKQTGIFGESFAMYERENIAKVHQWRLAATQFANLSGWDLLNRPESELIAEIVEEVLQKLRKSSYRISNAKHNLVGMNYHMEEMNSCLGEGELDDVRFVGICGMGGIGKTTIARAVYADISCQFEGSCFLANVREVEEKYGLVQLQEQLLSEILMERNITIWDSYSGINEIRSKLCRKKVLIVLDDVNELNQLKSLAGMVDWFGDGSKIIITTRDEHLLSCHGVENIYKVEGLNHDEALRLFCSKAFKADHPAEEFLELSNHFVHYANGLPLALDVLGSFLFGKSPNEWESALNRLREIPNREILDKLYISFDGLQEVEKKIFLDIACFFKGEDKDYVTEVLESCGFYPEIGLRVLLNKSLIAIYNDRIWMHDLLQEMGREIVRQSSNQEPGKRSRLWLYKDVYHVLSKNTGTDRVEGIVLDSCELEVEDEHLSAKAFMKMNRLRFLKLKNLHFSDNLDCLSNKIRYLDWEGYPFKSLPSNFQPDKLVELHIRCSNIQNLWKGIKPLKMLKVIDLSYSVNLIKTMDFKQVPNLEKLNLEGCTRLYEVHESVGVLKRLKVMNLKDCKGLVRIPDTICDLKSLKVLILQGCSKLDKLPDGLGDMASLEKLQIGGIGTKQVPQAKLWDLVIPSWLVPKKNPNSVTFLPSLSVLSSLRTLDLSYCNLLEGTLPNDLSCFPMLQTLNLSGNNFVSIPTSIIRLSKLVDLRLADCKKLQSLPALPSDILYLSTHGCSSLGNSSPKNVTSHHKSEHLCVPNCERLQSMPGLASTVINLSVEGLTAYKTSQSPLQTEDSKHSSLKFVNCIQLVEVRAKNCTTFGRLTSYLHFLLKHSSQGLFSPTSHVSMCLAGNVVPEWFNYRGMGCSLEVNLPEYWFSSKWMGFAICVVFEVNKLSLSETATLSCDLHARNISDQLLLLGRPSTEISAGDISDNNVASKIWFNFIPGSSISSVNWWEASKKIKISVFSKELKVKYCGFRIIYEHDVGELIQCNRLENLAVHSCDNSVTSKRIHEDYCSDSEPNGENGNFAKRMKMP